MEKVKLENTFVVRTDDSEMMKALGKFLDEHCQKNNVNAALFELSKSGGEKVLDIVFSEK